MLPYLIAGAIGFGIGKLFEKGGETDDKYGGQRNKIVTELKGMKGGLNNKAPYVFLKEGYIYVSAENGDNYADYYEYTIDEKLEDLADRYNTYWDWETAGSIVLAPIDTYAGGGKVSAKLKKLKSEMKQIWEETGDQYSDKKEMLMSAGYDDSDSNDLKHEEWKYLGNDVQIKLINDYFAYYEKLAVYVQGVGSIYNGTSMQSAANKANSYLKNNPKAEIVISDEKYGDTYDLDGYKIDEEYAVGGGVGLLTHQSFFIVDKNGVPLGHKEGYILEFNTDNLLRHQEDWEGETSDFDVVSEKLLLDNNYNFNDVNGTIYYDVTKGENIIFGEDLEEPYRSFYLKQINYGKFANGGLAKKRRRSASVQYGGSDRLVDKTRFAKPVGYRFTDTFAKKKRKVNHAIPKKEEIKQFLGKGIYKESRRNRSDRDRNAKL